MIQLSNLRPWEKVDTVIRRHWIILFILWAYAAGGIMVSGIVLFLLPSVYWFLLTSIFWMFYSLFLYVNWLNYELDVFVITNNRIVCVEQKSFLNRAVGECTLDKLQEIGIETKWLFANLLDFGTVVISTAGSTSNFDMKFVPTPMKHSRHINNIVDRYRDSLMKWESLNAPDERWDTPGKKVKEIIESA